MLSDPSKRPHRLFSTNDLPRGAAAGPSECIAHVLRGLCEQNPKATAISIDGVSAFDQISRAAMLDGLLNVEGGGAVLPFVRMFHGAPSSFLWKTPVVWCTRSAKAKGVSKETRSCLSCLQWDSTAF